MCVAQDVAQFVQEELYRFVLGPEMMERVRRHAAALTCLSSAEAPKAFRVAVHQKICRHECSSVISMELAIALAAQDKKVEDERCVPHDVTLSCDL